jgi:hypothetical protein
LIAAEGDCAGARAEPDAAYVKTLLTVSVFAGQRALA